jgi:hypothetical protein
MSQYSSIGLKIILFLVGLVILLLGVGYYHYSEIILKFCLVVALVVTLFSLAVIILIEGDRYGRWWYQPIVPLISVILFDVLIGVIKFKLIKAVASKGQEIVNQPYLPFSNIIPQAPTMPFAHYVALIIIFVCHVFCALAFLSKLLDERSQYSYSSLRFFSDFSVVTILVWLFTVLLVFS